MGQKVHLLNAEIKVECRRRVMFNKSMTLKADEAGRLACPELFPPNSVFNAVPEADGTIRLRKLESNEVPIVEPVRTKEGYLMLPVKITGKQIAAAIRKDRDAP